MWIDIVFDLFLSCRFRNIVSEYLDIGYFFTLENLEKALKEKNKKYEKNIFDSKPICLGN